MPRAIVPYRGGARRTLADRKCEVCGTIFRPKGSRQHCCSFPCARKAAGPKSGDKQRKGPRACARCGKPTNRYRRRFCSHFCYSESRKGVPVPREIVEKSRPAMRAAWARKRDPSRRAALKRARMSPEWAAWRKAVFERDDYICQSCGVRGGKLHPHHVKKFAEHPELAYDVSNGMTLCIPCHRKTENYGNKKGSGHVRSCRIDRQLPTRRRPCSGQMTFRFD